MKITKIDIEKIIGLEEKLQKQCYIDGDYIVINVRYPYEIHKDRCKTYKDIVDWVLQLSSKNWTDKILIERFIEVARSLI